MYSKPNDTQKDSDKQNYKSIVKHITKCNEGVLKLGKLPQQAYGAAEHLQDVAEPVVRQPQYWEQHDL